MRTAPPGNLHQWVPLPDLQRDILPGIGSAQNKKLNGSHIVECSELEDAYNGGPCKFMSGPDYSQSELCPGCWSAALFKIRDANSKGRKTTAPTGLIRLGTWREVLEPEWRMFIQGKGTRRDGTTWERPDFRTRKYFLITRGLEPLTYMRAVADHANCLNIQVSVDIIRTSDGRTVQVPPDHVLAELVKIPKTLFRFKTLADPITHKGTHYEANMDQFVELADRLSIPRMRVLETPLRLGTHTYMQRVPLESRWDPRTFLRCNTACNACPMKRDGGGENRILACAATPRIIKHLERVGNIQPYRQQAEAHVNVPWTDATREALVRIGPTATLQAIYAEVTRVWPDAKRNPLYDVKIRQAVRRVAKRTGQATWTLQSGTDWSKPTASGSLSVEGTP